MNVGDTVLIDDGSSTRRRRYTIISLTQKFVVVEDRAGVQTFVPRHQIEQIEAQRLEKESKGHGRTTRSVWVLFVPWGGQPRSKK